jgi:hypothetical protein
MPVSLLGSNIVRYNSEQKVEQYLSSNNICNNYVSSNSLTWIEKDQIAGNYLNKFLKNGPETSPLYGISSKLLRQLIIESIDASLNYR